MIPTAPAQGMTNPGDTPCGEPHCTTDHRSGWDPLHQANGTMLPASGAAREVGANYIWDEQGGLFYLMTDVGDGINLTREAWTKLIADMQRMLEAAGDRADAPEDW